MKLLITIFALAFSFSANAQFEVSPIGKSTKFTLEIESAEEYDEDIQAGPNIYRCEIKMDFLEVHITKKYLMEKEDKELSVDGDVTIPFEELSETELGFLLGDRESILKLVETASKSEEAKGSSLALMKKAADNYKISVVQTSPDGVKVTPIFEQSDGKKTTNISPAALVLGNIISEVCITEFNGYF